MGWLKTACKFAKDGVRYITKKAIGNVCEKIKRGISKLEKFARNAFNIMHTVLQKLESKVMGTILGAAHFFRRVGNQFQEGTKNYSLDEEIGEWHETTVRKDIALEDVPPQYRSMENGFEIDDTCKLEEALVY